MTDLSRISYQTQLPKEYNPDRWATVGIKVSPNNLILNRKNRVVLTAFLKVREGQAQGSTFFLPKLEGADLQIPLASPGMTVREVPQGILLQNTSTKPQQQLNVVLDITPHHASSLDLKRVFMTWVSLSQPLFPLEVSGGNPPPTVQSRSLVTYTGSVSIPISSGGKK